MNPRIDKLLRQRDLLREHLNWIEEEIATAHPEERPAPTESNADLANTTPERARQDTDSAPSPDVVDSPNEAFLPEPDATTVHSEVRTGCLLYFGIASMALGLLIAYIYWRY